MKPEVTSEQIQEQESATQTESGQQVHLLNLLIVLSKSRKSIFLFTLCVIFLAIITVLLLPVKYTATTVVLPPSQSGSMSSALLGQLGSSSGLAAVAGAGLGMKNPSDMYVSLFRSRTLEDSLIQRFGLMSRYHTKRVSDARRTLESTSKVALGVKDGLITISVTDTDARMAADITNGYVDEFRKLSARLAITEASQRRVFFQQQLLEANENLTAAEEAMKKTEQSTGALQVDSQARSLIESAAILRGQVVAKEVELQAMRTYATEGNPEMLVAQQELSALKAQLAKLSGSDVNSSSDIIVPKGNIPAAQMEYIRKLRDVRYYETISDLIAKQFEMAKLDEAREGAVIQVVDIAVPPDKHSFPKRALTIIVATVTGFFVACIWCIFFKGLQRLLNSPTKRKELDSLRAALR